MAEENKNTGGSVPADAQDKLESSKTHARKAAEDLKSAAGAVAGEYRDKAGQVWEDLAAKRSKSGVTRGIARALSRKMASNTCAKIPTKAVFTALGIGFVLGLIFRR